MHENNGGNGNGDEEHICIRLFSGKCAVLLEQSLHFDNGVLA